MGASENKEARRLVLIAAGASGGHVYPALATAEVLRERGHTVEFVGGDRLEARVIPESGFRFHPLPVPRPPSVRREILTPRGARVLASYVTAIRRASRLLRTLDPDVVLGMGGFAAVPASVAAGRLRIPLVLHEQNANLSLAQRLALGRASLLALGLPLRVSVRRSRTETLLVGNPVRRSIARLASLEGESRAAAKAAARRRLGLEADRPTLLVMGGSLSSGPLNEDLPKVDLPSEAQVLHLAGSEMREEVELAWSRRPFPTVVLGYLDAMEDAYLAADLAVCRAGAITVAELALAGLPAVLVPLETLKRGDQEANARILAEAGAARVVLRSDSSFGSVVAGEVSRLLADPEALAPMSQAAAKVAGPDAAERLAEAVLDRSRGAGQKAPYP